MMTLTELRAMRDYYAQSPKHWNCGSYYRVDFEDDQTVSYCLIGLAIAAREGVLGQVLDDEGSVTRASFYIAQERIREVLRMQLLNDSETYRCWGDWSDSREWDCDPASFSNVNGRRAVIRVLDEAIAAAEGRRKELPVSVREIFKAAPKQPVPEPLAVEVS